MNRSRRPSSQTVKVLRALAADPLAWRYGYELGSEVGLRSGSLYPILVRLSDRAVLEAIWEADPPVGRPPAAPVPPHRARPRVCIGACVLPDPRTASCAAARTARCDIGGLFVIALLLLVVVRVVPILLRLLRAAPADANGDRASRALTLAIGALPAGRADWGNAMLAELGEVRGGQARWRFSLGCSRTALALTVRDTVLARDRSGHGVRAVVLGGIVAALVLAGYGLVRYPGLRSWASVGFLLVVLIGYASCALSLSRGTTRRASTARRNGLLGGLAVGAAWLVILAPTSLLKAWVFVPLLVALLGPVAVAVLTGLTSRDARAARAAAMWSGLVGGLLVFVIWATATYVRDGRPYDPQLVRDFHHSHAHDLATYAVSDNLGAALGLLLIIPIVAVALGSLGAYFARPRIAASTSP